MEFAEYLKLKDQSRDRLQPNPERDTNLYVDLDGLVPACMAKLAARAPKLVLMGDYGTGKTHLLHVIQAQVDSHRFETVYLKLEPFGKWAESKHLHDALVTAMESRGLLQAAIKEIDDGQNLNRDVALAFERLRETPDDPDVRSWLLARGPTPARARKLGFSAPLSAFARGVTYAEIWRHLADGFRKSTGKELLFLIDESETFQESVDQTRAADMGVAIREMFDSGNKSYGVVMGLTAPKGRIGGFSSHPLGRPDVASRVQDVLLQLGRLETEERRRAFISNLLGRLFVEPKGFITDDAFEAVVSKGPVWARMTSLISRDPVQREYVKYLDTIARSAFLQHHTLPLDIQSVAPTPVPTAGGVV